MTSSCLGVCKGGAEADQNQSWAAVLTLCGQGLPLQCPSCSGFAPVFICYEIWEQIWETFGGGWVRVVLHIHTKATPPAACRASVPGTIPSQPPALSIPLAPSPSLHRKPPHCSGSSTLKRDRAQSIRSRGQLFKVEWQQAWELFMGSGQLGPFSRPRREEYFYISSPQDNDRRTSHLSVVHQPRCAFLCQNCSKYLVPGIQLLVQTADSSFSLQAVPHP